MKTLGIVGGIAQGSTVDYYRSLIARYRERNPDGSYPPILITSIDLTRMLALVADGRRTELIGMLGGEIDRLARAGADFALLASNTPHIVFDDLPEASRIPLLSIVEVACDAAAAMGLASVGLLGTRFTMEGRFYPDVFARRGITVRPPRPADLDYVHAKYVGELIEGDFRPATRDGVLAVIDRLGEDGAEGVVLAGTELPLLLGEVEKGVVPLLDTTRLHVDRAVTEMLG
jgi:aspartate racemase